MSKPNVFARRTLPQSMESNANSNSTTKESDKVESNSTSKGSEKVESSSNSTSKGSEKVESSSNSTSKESEKVEPSSNSTSKGSEKVESSPNSTSKESEKVESSSDSTSKESDKVESSSNSTSKESEKVESSSNSTSKESEKVESSSNSTSKESEDGESGSNSTSKESEESSSNSNSKAADKVESSSNSTSKGSGHMESSSASNSKISKLLGSNSSSSGSELMESSSNSILKVSGMPRMTSEDYEVRVSVDFENGNLRLLPLNGLNNLKKAEVLLYKREDSKLLRCYKGNAAKGSNEVKFTANDEYLYCLKFQLQPSRALLSLIPGNGDVVIEQKGLVPFWQMKSLSRGPLKSTTPSTSESGTSSSKSKSTDTKSSSKSQSTDTKSSSKSKSSDTKSSSKSKSSDTKSSSSRSQEPEIKSESEAEESKSDGSESEESKSEGSKSDGSKSDGSESEESEPAEMDSKEKSSSDTATRSKSSESERNQEASRDTLKSTRSKASSSSQKLNKVLLPNMEIIYRVKQNHMTISLAKSQALHQPLQIVLRSASDRSERTVDLKDPNEPPCVIECKRNTLYTLSMMQPHSRETIELLEIESNKRLLRVQESEDAPKHMNFLIERSHTERSTFILHITFQEEQVCPDDRQIGEYVLDIDINKRELTILTPTPNPAAIYRIEQISWDINRKNDPLQCHRITLYEGTDQQTVKEPVGIERGRDYLISVKQSDNDEFIPTSVLSFKKDSLYLKEVDASSVRLNVLVQRQLEMEMSNLNNQDALSSLSVTRCEAMDGKAHFACAAQEGKCRLRVQHSSPIARGSNYIDCLTLQPNLALIAQADTKPDISGVNGESEGSKFNLDIDSKSMHIRLVPAEQDNAKEPMKFAIIQFCQDNNERNISAVETMQWLKLRKNSVYTVAMPLDSEIKYESSDQQQRSLVSLFSFDVVDNKVTNVRARSRAVHLTRQYFPSKSHEKYF